MEKNPLGHPDGCPCENCQDWRDATIGLALLAQLKQVQKGAVPIGHCANGHAVLAGSKFCETCGIKL